MAELVVVRPSRQRVIEWRGVTHTGGVAVAPPQQQGQTRHLDLVGWGMGQGHGARTPKRGKPPSDEDEDGQNTWVCASCGSLQVG
jgi:hypothetical protein